jgi:DNA polymerase-3 subunit epsilon
LLNRKLTRNNFHHYVNPERDSHEDALKVHGISNEFLRDKPLFAHIADELLAYIEGAELIIHNAPFDLAFLNKELERLGKGPITEFVLGITDTLAMAKDMFPGKRNSLDALCDRLEVDNSGRTLHGALLDAELLADVYINMTRGQDALLIDAHSTGTAEEGGVSLIDLRQFDLPVIQASEQECAAHEEVLKQMDKSSGGKVVFRSLENSVA